MAWLKAHGLQSLIHLAALAPLVLLIWDGANANLTANPVQEIQLRTGRYALALLALSLACTPASTLFGVRQALRLRRPLGLYAFMYAGLHFLNFIGLDYQFDIDLIREDFAEKRFIVAGFVAFLCLLVLAVASATGWRQRLRWLGYLAAVLAVTHFAWQVKADLGAPLLYAAAVALLLLARLPRVRRAVAGLRSMRGRL
ncbi:MAG: ferric reductase-like transmembrane domain-containing protein [Chloroflexi bacterium]|nr:ferric reductase-like transmembrane domain-containing protein [Chloroflexota bacterium]